MSWIPAILEVDREEHEARGERYPLDIYGDDFADTGGLFDGGKNNGAPQGKFGWFLVVLMSLIIVGVAVWIAVT